MRTNAMVVLNRISTRQWVGRFFAGLAATGFLAVQGCGSAGTLEDTDQYKAGVDDALKKGQSLEGSGGSPGATGGSPGVTGGSPAVTGGSGGGMQSSTCGAMNIQAGCAQGTALVTEKCLNCHGALASAFQTIEFMTDPKAALVNQPARYTGVTTGTCPSQKEILLDPNNFDQSLLVTKVRGTGFACGTPMPQTGQLPAAEVTCILEWACALTK